MKIAVYAISKNEGKFVERFCKSATGADYIIIADTGSDDNTVAEALRCGATVHNIAIKPWRFETARNAALALVPSDVDICVSIDIDEILVDGWRKILEDAWKPGTTRLSYLYDWGNGLQFTTSKIHQRWGYLWNYPCHEYVEPDGRTVEQYAFTEKLLVQHLPDPTKSRGSYMEVLTAAVKENPDNARNQFYYARELTFNARWEEAEALYRKILGWKDRYSWNELDYCRRKLAECLSNLERTGEAQTILREACALTPGIREPWIDLADFCMKHKLWVECQYAARQSLVITHREPVYTAEAYCWGSKPYDLLALSSFYLGDYDMGLKMGQQALTLDPNNERLKGNMEFYLNPPSKEPQAQAEKKENLLFKN